MEKLRCPYCDAEIQGIIFSKGLNYNKVNLALCVVCENVVVVDKTKIRKIGVEDALALTA